MQPAGWHCARIRRILRSQLPHSVSALLLLLLLLLLLMLLLLLLLLLPRLRLLPR